jgi:hypothetical protein
MVGFRTPAGEWVRVVSGESVFDAASHALAFFASDGWYDPRPLPEALLVYRRIISPGGPTHANVHHPAQLDAKGD